MNLERYEYKMNKNFREYIFYSEGPGGYVKKVVQFSLESSGGIPYYNICFGDWTDKVQKVDDFDITNNGDRDKVLATVAVIILEFSRHYPDTFIYLQGSTASRTRLYRMGLTKLWKEISHSFDVFGILGDGRVERYRENINYNAFMIHPK